MSKRWKVIYADGDTGIIEADRIDVWASGVAVLSNGPIGDGRDQVYFGVGQWALITEVPGE